MEDNSLFKNFAQKTKCLHDYDIRYEALQEGTAIGAQQKAVEAAVMLVNDYKENPEVAAKKVNAPLELVLEALKN